MSVSHPHSQPTLALKARRARQFLGGAGVSREDSDDELGYEDHPWEWVYEDKLSGRPFSPHKVEKSLPSRSLGNTENPVMTPTMFASSSYQQEGSESSDTDDRKIIGARMGQFQCRLGDCVLLKSEVNQEAWVGLICEFQQDIENDCKAANFMWFSTESEIRNKQKKMMDFMPVRIA
ncbi:MAG: Origin recognition complex, subunit 1 [Trizodia sp. TS-e1964]|nr:MAG: Origin recognition complex, subunit 1 [Trizodia sp. TS-e1964]